jgi:hypothetical protein
MKREVLDRLTAAAREKEAAAEKAAKAKAEMDRRLLEHMKANPIEVRGALASPTFGVGVERGRDEHSKGEKDMEPEKKAGLVKEDVDGTRGNTDSGRTEKGSKDKRDSGRKADGGGGKINKDNNNLQMEAEHKARKNKASAGTKVGNDDKEHRPHPRGGRPPFPSSSHAASSSSSSSSYSSSLASTSSFCFSPSALLSSSSSSSQSSILTFSPSSPSSSFSLFSSAYHNPDSPPPPPPSGSSLSLPSPPKRPYTCNLSFLHPYLSKTFFSVSGILLANTVMMDMVTSLPGQVNRS